MSRTGWRCSARPGGTRSTSWRSTFVSAIGRYLQQQAQIVIDHCHLVQLATDAVTEVRRRITMTTRGRRRHGRANDPESRPRNLLRCNREVFTEAVFAKQWNTLIDLGGPGVTIPCTWIGKDRFCPFNTWCADAGVPNSSTPRQDARRRRCLPRCDHRSCHRPRKCVTETTVGHYFFTSICAYARPMSLDRHPVSVAPEPHGSSRAAPACCRLQISQCSRHGSRAR
jgi:hypothetical protein